MPEGPELYLSCKYVNEVCRGKTFGGKIEKSPVSKQPDIDWMSPEYTISATSRGKEIKLILTQCNANNENSKNIKSRENLSIVLQFGMTGKFAFYPSSDLRKHAHLNFFTTGEPSMVLSFIDSRRFGSWRVGDNWSDSRGPCVLTEYKLFREHVLNNLEESVFDKPVCEVLLNQKFFNGIGNYLRAEILYRAGIPPFVSARSALEPLLIAEKENAETKVKLECMDLLQLCNLLPQEVIGLGGTWYDGEGDGSSFNKWLQCYYQPGMQKTVDHNKRTIWFKGHIGPMASKEGKTKKALKGKHKKEDEQGKNKILKSEKLSEEPAESETSPYFPTEVRVPLRITRNSLKILKKLENEIKSQKQHKNSNKVSKSAPITGSSSVKRNEYKKEKDSKDKIVNTISQRKRRGLSNERPMTKQCESSRQNTEQVEIANSLCKRTKLYSDCQDHHEIRVKRSNQNRGRVKYACRKILKSDLNAEK